MRGEGVLCPAAESKKSPFTKGGEGRRKCCTSEHGQAEITAGDPQRRGMHMGGAVRMKEAAAAAHGKGLGWVGEQGFGGCSTHLTPLHSSSGTLELLHQHVVLNLTARRGAEGEGLGFQLALSSIRN